MSEGILHAESDRPIRRVRKRRATNGAADPNADYGAIVSFRIPTSLKERMYGLRYGPYKIHLSDVVIRGIELALAELEAANGPGRQS